MRVVEGKLQHYCQQRLDEANVKYVKYDGTTLS